MMKRLTESLESMKKNNMQYRIYKGRGDDYSILSQGVSVIGNASWHCHYQYSCRIINLISKLNPLQEFSFWFAKA